MRNFSGSGKAVQKERSTPKITGKTALKKTTDLHVWSTTTGALTRITHGELQLKYGNR